MDIKRIRLCVGLDVNIRGAVGVHKKIKRSSHEIWTTLNDFYQKNQL